MAPETEATEQTGEETAGHGGSNGSDDNARRTLIRTAAVAAAASAAALAARKVLSESSQAQTGEGRNRRESAGGDESLLGSMLQSGWGAAQDSLLPFAEDAAAGAGEFVARNAPEIVSERLLPRFISGFERARTQDDRGD